LGSERVNQKPHERLWLLGDGARNCTCRWLVTHFRDSSWLAY
jgi:hypothetical protein